MQSFHIPTMTCGHCVRAVTQAVHSVDPKAKVEVHLAEHRIDVTSIASTTSLSAAIAAAGYVNAPKA